MFFFDSKMQLVAYIYNLHIQMFRKLVEIKEKNVLNVKFCYVQH